VLQGNFIGTKADGLTPLGNETHNVDIRFPGGANNNVIGGVAAGSDNVIAFVGTPGPGYDGIRIRDGNTGNLIRGNSIFGNGTSAPLALGIDMGANGVTLNDDVTCDSDTGANQLQNFPVLTNALAGGGALRIGGALTSAASTSYLLQFYANTVVDYSGYGEGQTYLGSTNITTSAGCSASFNLTLLHVSAAPGQYLTATATDPNNNTSEFSQALLIQATPTLSYNWVSDTGESGDPSKLHVSISWPSNALSYQVEILTNLAPPIVWYSLGGSPTYSNGVFTWTETPTNNEVRLFRLRNP
jgi:hypothetical protein